MTEKIQESLEEETTVDPAFQSLTSEQQVDLLFASLTEFLDRMEARGIDPTVTHCVLISTLAVRMSEMGAREEFEQYLTEALEEPWPEVSVH